MLFNRSDNDPSNAKIVTGQSENDSTSEETAAERIALRKVDWHILPMVFMYYMVSFLDR